MGTLTTGWQEVGVVALSGVNGAYLKLFAKYNSQSIANNSSSISVELRISCASGTYFHCYTHSASFGGSFSNSTSVGSYYHGWESGTVTTILSETKDIGHDANGNLNLSLSGAFDCSVGVKGSVGLSETWSLPQIARGFSAKPTLTITSIQEQRIDFRWNTSENCNRIRLGYKLPSASTFSWASAVTIANTKTGTSYVETGLTAGTTYDFCVECRKSDSNLTMNSESQQKTMYSYPSVTGVETTSITLPVPTGQSSQVVAQTIYLNNPLSRTGITVYAKTANTAVEKTWTVDNVSGTSTAINLVVNDLYTSLGNEGKIGSIQYYCTYSGHTTAAQIGDFATVSANCCPSTTGSLSYINDSSDHVTLLGSNQYIIQGKSKLKITGPTYGFNGGFGSIAYYEFSWNNQKPIQSDSTTINYTSVSDAGEIPITMCAVDKRGYKSAPSTATVHVLPYQIPSLQVVCTRTGEYEDATGTISLVAKRSTLTVSGTEKNKWMGDTTSNKIKYTVSPTSSSLVSGGTVNSTAASFSTDIAVTALDPQSVYTLTFDISDSITSNLQVVGSFEQAESIFDWNIDAPAFGVGAIVNKSGVLPGFHGHGLYITDRTGQSDISQIQTTSVVLGKAASTVSIAGYGNMTAQKVEAVPISTKTGATITNTNKNLSNKLSYGETVNGELFIGGPLSDVKQGKFYLYNGEAYIPIIWYHKNS